MSPEPRSRTPLLLLAASFAVVAAGAGYFVGTRRPTPEAPVASAAPIVEAVETTIPSSGPTGDEVRPVYPMLAGSAAAPAAVALCDALYALPMERRATCCNVPKSTGFATECARNVSGALTSGQVLDDKSLAACTEASRKLHDGCDWVTPLASSLPLPKECQGLLKGKLGNGATCRSGYECLDGLACHGAGPTSVGRCGPPKTQGACNVGVDVLGSYLRDKTFDRRHPECAGYCSRHVCLPLVKRGEKCVSDDACGPDLRCIEGTCAASSPGKSGDSCAKNACESGLSCVNGTCAVPHRDGETCDQDSQCRGRCRAPKDSERRVCGPTCQFDLPFAKKRNDVAPPR